MDSSPSEAALARWLAGGFTSLSHPVLAHALRTRLHPLGIRAAWLESEPFSDLETGGGGWWLRGARWEAAGFDPGHPAAADFACLLGQPGQFAVTVDPRGQLAIAPASRAPGPEALSWFGQSGAGWAAVRHSVRAAASLESFIYAAAGSILAGSTAASLYAEGKTTAFCMAIDGLLDKGTA